jgi:hypothetical protein
MQISEDFGKGAYYATAPGKLSIVHAGPIECLLNIMTRSNLTNLAL